MTARATTIRLKEDLQSALATLSEHTQRPMNTLVNEAVQSYLDQNLPKAENELEATLAKLRAYRKHDPNFEQSLRAFADSEVKFKDGIDGRVVKKKTKVSIKSRRVVTRKK